MKKFIAIVAVAFTVFAAKARDPYDMHPLQVSLFPSLQVFDPDVHITGLKLNLIWGYNETVSGFDVGLFSSVDDFEGVQLNLVNYVDQTAGGIRLSLLNVCEDAEGIEIGLVNYASVGADGLRVGLVNVTDESKGLQIGLINYTKFMQGIQIGLINVIAESSVPCLPILNARF